MIQSGLSLDSATILNALFYQQNRCCIHLIRYYAWRHLYFVVPLYILCVLILTGVFGSVYLSFCWYSDAVRINSTWILTMATLSFSLCLWIIKSNHYRKSLSCLFVCLSMTVLVLPNLLETWNFAQTFYCAQSWWKIKLLQLLLIYEYYKHKM